MRRTALVQFAVRHLGQRSFRTGPIWQRQCSTRPVLRTPSASVANNVTRLLRFASGATPRPLTDRGDDEAASRRSEIEARHAEQPSYEMTFTCKKCNSRSTHRISKQGYNHGTILINCPGCENKHLISDHLGIFSDRGVTLEDIMKEKGELLKKGLLGANGDVEFYEEPEKQKKKKS